jgi:hypothetical protein
VEWKGQAFSYLMHHPGFNKTENYGSSKAAAGAKNLSCCRVCGPEQHSHLRFSAHTKGCQTDFQAAAGGHGHASDHGHSSSDVGTRVSWQQQQQKQQQSLNRTTACMPVQCLQLMPLHPVCLPCSLRWLFSQLQQLTDHP